MARLDGKSAIVTGGASGIGAATTRLFIAEGAQVMITDVQTDRGNELAATLGEHASFMRHDVTRAAEWDEVIGATEAKFGKINVLINNAGIAGTFKAVVDMSEVEYRRVIDVNQLSVFLGIRAVVPAMIRAGGGSIANVSSANGLVGASHMIDYCAAKFAVTGMTKSAALELGDHHIRVNSVHPGMIETPMALAMLASRGIAAETFTAGFALKRWGVPEEIAEVLLFLASDASSLCTGAAISADGGLTAK